MVACLSGGYAKFGVYHLLMYNHKETLINSVREFVADFGCSPKPKNVGVAEATARLFWQRDAPKDAQGRVP